MIHFVSLLIDYLQLITKTKIDSHTALVVGDPFKDTSSPAMNILINIMAIVSLVIAPLHGYRWNKSCRSE